MTLCSEDAIRVALPASCQILNHMHLPEVYKGLGFRVHNIYGIATGAAASCQDAPRPDTLQHHSQADGRQASNKKLLSSAPLPFPPCQAVRLMSGSNFTATAMVTLSRAGLPSSPCLCLQALAKCREGLHLDPKPHRSPMKLSGLGETWAVDVRSQDMK